MDSRSHKRERNVIVLQKLQYFVHKLQCVLHKTTNCTTNIYTKLQAKLCVHVTHKVSKSHTKSQHIDIAMYKIHTKLTLCVLEMSILHVVCTFSL